jgi:hypothetical protein
MKTTWLALLLLASSTLHADAAAWNPTRVGDKAAVINGRAMETFEAGVKPEWGYAKPQQDTFVVLYPKEDRNRISVRPPRRVPSHTRHGASRQGYAVSES